jgi:hypothetical protein
MINVFDCQSHGLLLVQLDQQTLNKDSAMQRVFRPVNKEGLKLDSLFCDGSSQ